MLTNRRVVRSVAKIIADAADNAFEAYRDDRAKTEPNVTDRVLGAIEQAVNGSSAINGITWKSATLQASRGRGAEESTHGADFMGVLDIHLKDFKVRKGFLAQAKRAEPNRSFSKSEWDRLIGQAETMISRTPASFVFIYSVKRGIRIVPAITVLGMSGRQLFASYDRSVARFFEDHLSSFIGDPRLSVPDVKHLGSMSADWDARSVLYLYARERADDRLS